jgi:hypothetical protein
MAHKTEVIKAKETDSAIAITIRCCDDPQTDSALTVYGVHKITPEQLEIEVNNHHDRVAAKHEAMGKMKDALSKLNTKTKVHSK